MIYEFFLSGEVVSKKNSNRFDRATGRVYKTTTYRKWYRQARKELLEKANMCYSGEFITPLTKTETLTLTFRHKDNKRRDSDNQTTSVLDLLVDCRVLFDDNIKVVPTIIVHNEQVEKTAQVGCLIKIEV